VDSIRDAINSLIDVVNDPDLDISDGDREDLNVAIGVLIDYQDDA
jgi:hypothetical protein